ncbi:hypothetical protein LJR175_000989 [Variovorax sp. LjRoot175]|uniref:hypothetical protein n=1 Tax=Variovorax sp. LjRoot175 TaxID=3342276 RepID=UPI003ECD277F
MPKNWKSFQHYKDRAPPWIKLHRSLLDDRQYQRLPLASRALAPMLWLLAAEAKDGAFEGAVEELAFRLRTTEGEIEAGLKPLIDASFFAVEEQNAIASPQSREQGADVALAPCYQAASNTLADCERVATPETEGETEGEADGKNSAAAEPSASADSCPHQQIIELFHEVLPAARRVREWTPARQQALRARWREKPERQNLNWWRKFFGYVSASEFLCGRTTPAPGRKPFDLSLDWLCRSENLVKVVEGAYEN